MDIQLRVSGLTVDEIQKEVDLALATDDAAAVLADEGNSDVDRTDGLEVRAGQEGFGAIELILIAAAGRLVASVPERIIVRLFDEVVWPRLKLKFGGNVKRGTDEEGDR